MILILILFSGQHSGNITSLGFCRPSRILLSEGWGFFLFLFMFCFVLFLEVSCTVSFERIFRGRVAFLLGTYTFLRSKTYLHPNFSLGASGLLW